MYGDIDCNGQRANRGACEDQAQVWHKKGTKVAFIEQNGKLMIQPLDKSYFESLAGILGTNGKMMKSLMDDKKKEREL